MSARAQNLKIWRDIHVRAEARERAERERERGSECGGDSECAGRAVERSAS